MMLNLEGMEHTTETTPPVPHLYRFKYLNTYPAFK